MHLMIRTVFLSTQADLTILELNQVHSKFAEYIILKVVLVHIDQCFFCFFVLFYYSGTQIKKQTIILS